MRIRGGRHRWWSWRITLDRWALPLAIERDLPMDATVIRVMCVCLILPNELFWAVRQEALRFTARIQIRRLRARR